MNENGVTCSCGNQGAFLFRLRRVLAFYRSEILLPIGIFTILSIDQIMRALDSTIRYSSSFQLVRRQTIGNFIIFHHTPITRVVAGVLFFVLAYILYRKHRLNSDLRDINELFSVRNLGGHPSGRAREAMTNGKNYLNSFPITAKWQDRNKTRLMLSNLSGKCTVIIIESMRERIEAIFKTKMEAVLHDEKNDCYIIKFDRLPLNRIPAMSDVTTIFVGEDADREAITFNYSVDGCAGLILGSSGSGKSEALIPLARQILMKPRTLELCVWVTPKGPEAILPKLPENFRDKIIFLDPFNTEDLKRLAHYFNEVQEIYKSLPTKNRVSDSYCFFCLDEAALYLRIKGTGNKERRETMMTLIKGVDDWSQLYRSVGFVLLLAGHDPSADGLDISLANIQSKMFGSTYNPAQSRALINTDELFNPNLRSGRWFYQSSSGHRLQMRSPYGGDWPDHLKDRKRPTNRRLENFPA